MICGGASFCIGAILCAFAQDLAMLIIGRVCLGAGVGFANQVRLLLYPVAARMIHAIVTLSCSCTAVLHSMHCELVLSCGACGETWLSRGCLCIRCIPCAFEILLPLHVMLPLLLALM